MKRFVRILISLLPLAGILTLLTGCAMLNGQGKAKQGIPLALGSRATVVIVIPTDPPAPLRFAAEELKHYLDEMTGSEYRIVEGEVPDQLAIVLGEKLATEAGLDVGSLARDGYIIATGEGKLYVAGRDSRSDRARGIITIKDGPLPAHATQVEKDRAYGDIAWDFQRGTLNGVYHLLEYCGVRWYHPGPDGEVIPKKATIQLPPVEGRFEPFYYLRLAGEVTEELTHVPGYDGRAQRLWMVRMRASSYKLAYGDRPDGHDWLQRFGSTHPEYFTSTAPDDWHLNYTSEGVIRETAADAVAFFSRTRANARGVASDPQLAVNGGWDDQVSYGSAFSLTPNAGLKAPKQAPNEDGEVVAMDQSEYVWGYVNMIAAGFEEQLPGRLFTALARESYSRPPRSLEKLPRNVIVGIADTEGVTSIHGSLAKSNRSTLFDLAKQWDSRTEPPLLFCMNAGYRGGHTQRAGVPMFLPHRTAELLRELANHGRFVQLDFDTDNAYMDQITRYLAYKVLWNPKVDIEPILSDYLTTQYGEAAAEHVQAILLDIEAKSIAIATSQADAAMTWEEIYTHDVLAGYEAQIKLARLAATTPAQRQAVGEIDVHWLQTMRQARDAYVGDIRAKLDARKEVLPVLHTPTEIVVDGAFDEAAWAKATVLPFYNNRDGAALPKGTQVRLLWDKKQLYVAVETQAPGRIEIFSDSNGNGRDYHWLGVNTQGALDQMMFPAPAETGKAGWDSEAVVKVAKDGYTYRTEMAIPLKRIRLKPRPGKKLYPLTICFTQGQGVGAERASISPVLRGVYHQPAYFAKLDLLPPAE